jgi:hypothetical protein
MEKYQERETFQRNRGRHIEKQRNIKTYNKLIERDRTIRHKKLIKSEKTVQREKERLQRNVYIYIERERERDIEIKREMEIASTARDRIDRYRQIVCVRERVRERDRRALLVVARH